MGALKRIDNISQLRELVDELGFLPFFSGGLAGFSLMDLTAPGSWWNDARPQDDPWEWRKDVAAGGEIAYAKLFGGRAGFVSREWYPVFANYRRDGYDFDTLYETGRAPNREKRIMEQLQDGGSLPTFAIKRAAALEKGFEGALTALQMKTYLITRGFRRRVNRAGAEYGWPVAYYSTPESLFGAELVCRDYGEEPEASRRAIAERCAALSGASLSAAAAFIK